MTSNYEKRKFLINQLCWQYDNVPRPLKYPVHQVYGMDSSVVSGIVAEENEVKIKNKSVRKRKESCCILIQAANEVCIKALRWIWQEDL